MNKGPNATIRLVWRQNHAGTTVFLTTVQREKSSHAYKLSSNVQTACSTDSLNNCPKHSILRFSSFALKIYLWLKMCQHNLPCSIVYAHCLLPGRAFASLYVLLFLEKEAEIGGREEMVLKNNLWSFWEWLFYTGFTVLTVEQPCKAQANKWPVLPGPSLLAYTKYGCRWRFRPKIVLCWQLPLIWYATWLYFREKWFDLLTPPPPPPFLSIAPLPACKISAKNIDDFLRYCEI